MYEIVDRMFKKGKKKFIFPAMYYGLLSAYIQNGKTVFSTQEVRHFYETAVCEIVRNHLGHSLHIGGQFYDAYPTRNLTKYRVLKALGPRMFQLIATQNAAQMLDYICQKFKEEIQKRFGNLPSLSNRLKRMELSETVERFISFIEWAMSISGTCFELVSFALIKTHMERFGCKIYRETRAEASDRGTDLSTDFGVVYQVKKLVLRSERVTTDVYDTLLGNFGEERIRDGKVVLVLEDADKQFKELLVRLKIKPIIKNDLLKLALLMDEPEVREKVLRVVFDELKREYQSDVCRKCPFSGQFPVCEFRE